jgi:hypothetical protein
MALGVVQYDAAACLELAVDWKWPDTGADDATDPKAGFASPTASQLNVATQCRRSGASDPLHASIRG